ncbi:helix-turn-helix domain-containing protein [Pantanalinema sp. GBBB05]|uniref:helix-turn-helix domain-containing protein n=1 Tax=Pantanalinema sp. GBBB05 TaxID=2604139 RepID=UPI001DE69419|nr:helix-turn-helix transcriptional regulator [Pantanalinema sp. GBBB05]
MTAVSFPLPIDTSRIKACASKLRRNRSFRHLVLVQVAMGVNQVRLDRLAMGISEPLDLLHLYQNTDTLHALEPENLSKLELSFKKALRSTVLWEKAAIWFLTQLDTWEQHREIEDESAIPDILSILPDPKKPGEESWLEARLLSLLAAQVAHQLLSPLDLASYSIAELEALLGVEQPATKVLPHRRSSPASSTTGGTPPVSREWQAPELLAWRSWIGDSFIEHQILEQSPETQRLELIPGKAAWEILQQLGPEAAYLFLIFAAYASDADRPWQDQIRLTGRELLRFYGWDQHDDSTPGGTLKRISSLVQMVCGLSVAIVQCDTQPHSSATTGAIWVLEALEYIGTRSVNQDDRSQEPKATDLEELVIWVKPGRWTERFLANPEPAAIAALRQYGFMVKSTLQINPYRKRLAARLAMFLLVMSRLQPSGRYRVGTLLAAIESQSLVEELQQNRNQRHQLLEQWDSALLTLTQLGWEIKFDPRTYPRSLQPTWSRTEGSPTHSQIRPKAWLSQWLNAHLAITPTTLIQHRLEVSKTLTVDHEGFGDGLSDADANHVPETIPGYALEIALAAKGWSKAKLAEQLHLNRSMVTHWINGTRVIQPHHRQQLWHLLGRELQQVTGIRR